MKLKQLLRTLLCLCLVLGTVLALCACPGSTPPDDGSTTTPPDEGGTTPPDEGGTTPGGDEGTTPPEDNKPTPDLYNNGAPISGAGASLSDGSFAMTAPVYDESKATEVRPNSFFRTTKKEAGKVYLANGTKAVTIDEAGEYDGCSAILIAPNGVVIEDAEGVTLKNVTIIGSLTVKGAASLTLEKVAVISEGTALSVDAASDGLVAKDCRLVGKTALSLAADESAIIDSYLGFTEKGVVDTAATGTTVLGCVLEGSGTGIASAASESAFRSNTLKMGAASIGIQMESGILNGLVALNVITGAQSSITISGVTNVAVVLNSAVSIEASRSSDIYICDNNLGGRLTANNNNYLIADGNATPDDGYNHETVQSGNQNHNGDSLMDVTARPELGADEALLPHTNKELFVGMDRKSTVKDLRDSKAANLASYLTEHAKTDSYVIVAPGAYACIGGAAFGAEQSNTKVYAYGVYMERQGYHGNHLDFEGADNVTVKGLAVGSAMQSCGQVYILEKIGGNQVRVVTGAGMINEFGNTNQAYFPADQYGVSAQRAGTYTPYSMFNYASVRKESSGTVGTMIITLDRSLYQMVAKGDILTCRLNGAGFPVVMNDSKDIVFYDFTMYGNTAGFAFWEGTMRSATTYYRVHNTTRTGEIIDEATYNNYLELEKRYGVDLEISKEYIGDEPRFRGSPAHVGSLDATHTVDSAQGSQVICCIFENITDDATNQSHSAARLHDYKDNGDGTITLTYKGVYPSINYDNNNVTHSWLCEPFKAGDRVYIYTAKGQLVCDTEALSATVDLPDVSVTVSQRDGSRVNSKVPMRTVTIKSSALSEKAKEVLAQYDLSRNDHVDEEKVLVDNMSMASNGFLFDNSRFQNTCWRSLLIKASDGKVQNCTFRNVGGSPIGIFYEINWGESGVTENMLIDRNLFDNVGYYDPYPTQNDGYWQATVSIIGLGSSVEEDFLLYRNITISNNHFLNRQSQSAIYVNSAKDVHIINNTFGPFIGNERRNVAPETPTSPNKPIYINGAMNIEIAGNTFPYPDETVIAYDRIRAEKNKNVYGADVTYNGMSLVPDNP